MRENPLKNENGKNKRYYLVCSLNGRQGGSLTSFAFSKAKAGSLRLRSAQCEQQMKKMLSERCALLLNVLGLWKSTVDHSGGRLCYSSPGRLTHNATG